MKPMKKRKGKSRPPGVKMGMNPRMMAGKNRSQSMPMDRFFSGVNSVKPGPDMRPRRPLTGAQKKRLATRPI